MKTQRFLVPSILFVLVFFLLFAQPALAHGGDPRLEISAERLNPGSVLDIRGVDFEFEEAVDLLLVGPQMEVPFGTVLVDAEGIFILSITLPMDLAEGMYVMRATTDDHVVESPKFTIWGTGDLGEGGDGPREEEDGLLAPMPTSVPGDSPTPGPVVAPVETTPPVTSTMPLVWIAAGIGILLGLMLLRAKRS